MPRAADPARDVSRHVTAEPLSWELVSGRDDPAQRYALYRLCEGELQLIATVGTPQAAGRAFVELGHEGEWEECPVGLLDREGEIGDKWIFRPWLPSPRNVSDAGRMLRTARFKRGETC